MKLMNHTYFPAAKGDTLASVAQRFGVRAPAIVAENAPNYAGLYTHDGLPLSIKLPLDCKDAGSCPGATGKYKAS